MQPSTLIALFAAFVPFAAAACCHSTDGKCGDGTDGTPYCGYGPCDIFGCNCEGGCRSSSAASAGGIEVTPSKNTELAPADAFDAANVDGSGNLTLHQFTDYIGSSDDDKATSDFFKKLVADPGVFCEENPVADDAPQARQERRWRPDP